MTKFLLLVLVIVAVLWGPLSRLRAPTRRSPQPPRPGTMTGQALPQNIVPCAHCGVHLPRQEALPGPEHGRDLVFCSAEHRRLGPRADVA